MMSRGVMIIGRDGRGWRPGRGVEFPLQIAALQIQDQIQIKLGIARSAEEGGVIEPPDPCFGSVEFLGRREVGLVEDDEIGKGYLLAGLGGAFELPGHMSGVNDSDHALEHELGTDARVGVEAFRHRRRLCEAGCLDDDGVELRAKLGKLKETAQQVPANRAADAAVVHLNHFLIGRDQKVMIDADFTKFVDDDGDAAPVVRCQQPIQERCFPGAQKSGDDNDRSFLRGNSGIHHRARTLKPCC